MLLFKALRHFSRSRNRIPTNSAYQQSSPSSNKSVSPTNLARLHRRNLIVVSGDSYKFLQELAVNDLQQLRNAKASDEGKITALYTHFLNTKGRIITDAFVVRPWVFINGLARPSPDQLWLDVDESYSNKLLDHLKSNSKRKNVELTHLSRQEDKPIIAVSYIVDQKQQLLMGEEPSAYAGLKLDNLDDAKASSREDGTFANLCFLDPRGMRFGSRIYCGAQGFDISASTTQANETDYEQFCTLQAYARPQTQQAKLPFAFNPDLLYGTLSKKQPFPGKQTMLKGYSSGMVRRRVFSYVLHTQYAVPVGSKLCSQDGRQIGEVMESYPGHGLVLFNYLDFMKDDFPIQVKTPVQGAIYLVFKREMMNYLVHYLQQINQKYGNADLSSQKQ